MPLYEHVMISRQDLSGAQAEGLVAEFGEVLAKNGGTVVNSEYWGIRTMAYKIKKNRKGHYAMLRTDAPAAAVHEMERLMRLHDDVVRVLTVKVDAHKEGPSVQMQRRDDRERGSRGGRGGRGERRDRGPRPQADSGDGDSGRSAESAGNGGARSDGAASAPGNAADAGANGNPGAGVASTVNASGTEAGSNTAPEPGGKRD